jgi:hypothetical protein
MQERKSERDVTYIGLAIMATKAFNLDTIFHKLVEVQAWVPVDQAGSTMELFLVVGAVVLGYNAQRYGVKRLRKEERDGNSSPCEG